MLLEKQHVFYQNTFFKCHINFAHYYNQNHILKHVSSSLKRELSELSSDTLLETIERAFFRNQVPKLGHG